MSLEFRAIFDFLLPGLLMVGWNGFIEKQRQNDWRSCKASLKLIIALGLLLVLDSQIDAQAQVRAAVENGKGLILTTEDVMNEIPVVPTYRDYLPPSVDLSRFLPLPGKQGGQGSCTAWAVGYAARAYYSIASQGRVARDFSNVPSPAYIYNSIVNKEDCAGGSRINDALSLLRDFGSASLRDYPYNPNTCAKPSPEISLRSGDFRIKGFNRLDTTNDDVLDSIKGELAKDNPVILAIQTTPAFDDLGDEVYTETKSYLSRNHNGQHAITAIGYDEARQSFRLINSWGRNWGDNGFAWISYATLRSELLQAWVMRPGLPGPPPTCSLTAQPEVITRGETAMLSYKSSNAEAGQFDHGLGYAGIGGEQPVSPTQTTVYTATFRGGGGVVSCSAKVAVEERRQTPAPPLVSSFSASPQTVQAGQTAKLSWVANGATLLRVDPEIGAVTGSSVVVTPKTTTTYTLTASNVAGSAASRTTVTVQDPPPVPTPPSVSSFQANPQTIQTGQSARLSWSVTGATLLRIEPAIGPVTGSTILVTPKETTTYTLTASNAAGSATSKTTVIIQEPRPLPTPPSIASFDANPQTVENGQSTKLSWSVSGATSLRIDPTIGAVTGSSTLVKPKESTTYTLTASNAAGSVTSTASVSVSAPINLPDVGCGKISLSQNAGRRSVVGFVGKDDDLDKIRLAAPDAQLNVQVRPWPQCEALITLEKPLSVRDEPKVAIRRTTRDSLIEGDKVVFEIETPSYPSYLHVAYVQADGSVLNLMQPGDASFTAYPPHSKLVIGDDPAARRFRVSKPFGREMLIVLAGKSPTFPEPRPKQETERQFLTALRRALLYKPNPSAPDREVAAAFDTVITKERSIQ